MELETAAPQALSRVEELEKELDDARKELEGAQERLIEARERLDADGGALAEAAEAFQAAVSEQRPRLAQAAEKSGESLGELTEALRSSHQEAANELGQAASVLSGLEERVHALEPAVEESFSDAVAAAESVKGFVEETSAQLEQALGTARGLLDVATQDLLGMQELVQRRVEEIGEFEDQAWTPVLEEIAAAWGDSLEKAVGGAVAAGVEMTSENLPQVLAEATEQCRQQHEEALADLVELAERLEGALGTLAEAVELGTGMIVETGGQGASELGETAQGVARLEAGLQRVRELLATYTFVQL